MTLSTTSPVRRKDPLSRHRELASAAGRVALAEGLAVLTAKKVADEVGVYPGLVTHYFKTSDRLLAAAFAAAVESRRERPVLDAADADPLAQLRTFISSATTSENDDYALLWLDAWRESRRRPALQEEVVRQMEIDVADLTQLLELGCTTGVFEVENCSASAMRILATIDGTLAQSAVRSALAQATTLDYPVVTEMLLRHTETELGLAMGSLDPVDHAQR